MLRSFARIVPAKGMASEARRAACATADAVSGAGTGFDAEAALHSTPRTKEGAEQLYDQWAASYDETLQRWGYPAPRRAAAIMAQLAREHGLEAELRGGGGGGGGSGARLLDAGCGTGMVAEALRAEGAGCELTGTDISAESLAHVRAAKPGLYDATAVADLDGALPFGDGRFSFVACVGVLSYVQDFGRCFAEFHRVARPGALIVLTHVTERYASDERGSRSALEAMVADKRWERLLVSEPEPYMPDNPVQEEAAKTVTYFAYRNNA